MKKAFVFAPLIGLLGMAVVIILLITIFGGPALTMVRGWLGGVEEEVLQLQCDEQEILCEVSNECVAIIGGQTVQFRGISVEVGCDPNNQLSSRSLQCDPSTCHIVLDGSQPHQCAFGEGIKNGVCTAGYVTPGIPESCQSDNECYDGSVCKGAQDAKSVGPIKYGNIPGIGGWAGWDDKKGRCECITGYRLAGGYCEPEEVV